MAEVIGIISGLYTAGSALGTFAGQVKRWRHLSECLFDLREGLEAVELSLEQWKRKYSVQERRRRVYFDVIFGRKGAEAIIMSLGSIDAIVRDVRFQIDRIIGRALQASRTQLPDDFDIRHSEQLVADCIHRIRSRASWSQKFVYSVLGRAKELEARLEKLELKVTRLERISNIWLEKEHPDIFREIRRLPGRRIVLSVGDSRHDAIQKKLLDGLAARKDAELLHRASEQGTRMHIGLATPQIHRRDFAFLLSINGSTHDILTHPIKIKHVNDAARLQYSMGTAVPSLLRHAQKPCYMLPTASTSAGFQVSLPPSGILADLAHRPTLASTVNASQTPLTQETFYLKDQCAIVCGIAQGSFRLIGSPWLDSLDCRNVRWRRSVSGQWMTMLERAQGDASTTRTLNKAAEVALQRRDRRDLTKHVHIFRVGLVLTELALKMPITYVDLDPSSASVMLYIDGLGTSSNLPGTAGAVLAQGTPLDAEDVASEVEKRTNPMIADMVSFCLSALQDRDRMADRSIEAGYFKDVVGFAEELERFMRNGGNGKAKTEQSESAEGGAPNAPNA